MPRIPARKFLAAQARAGNGHGYTSTPGRPLPEVADPPEVIERIRTQTNLCDEPEAPSANWIDAEADLRRTYDQQRHKIQVAAMQKIRGALNTEARMAEARRQAKMRHIDISGELHAIDLLLKRAREGGRKEPPGAVARLEKVEARLDFRPDLDEAA